MADQKRSYLRETPPPEVTHPDARSLADWTSREIGVIMRRSNAPSELRLDVLYTAPAKPRAGMIVYADGTHWNPGAGEGVYRFSIAAAWVFLG